MDINRLNGTLSVTGLRELSSTNAHSLRSAVAAALSHDLHRIEIDLSEAQRVDGAGLGALVSVYESANEQRQESHVAMRLTNPQPTVRQMIELARLHHRFEITPPAPVLTQRSGYHREPKMKSILPLFIFIDACGWEIIKNDPFCHAIAPNRRRLESVFGYSSACVPSILSGRWPVEHRNWCYFVYNPKNSPFRWLKPLQWLPKALTSRRIVRRWLSKLVKVQLKFRGYFDLYNIPFKHISLFDFTEKKSPLLPRGMNRGPNLSDFLEELGIAYHVSDPSRSETENCDAMLEEVKSGRIDFGFVYWPDLDGLLHREGNQSAAIGPKLRGYEERIRQLVDAAQEQYEEVRLYVFSDHGMANCDTQIDLKARIEQLPWRMGKDYAVVYDSTMARFWFFNDRARCAVMATLQGIPEGRILPNEELDRLHCLFPDRYFGELIFLLREGVLIVPSHMGERPIRAMHGYHPEERHSYAALLTNQPEIPEDLTAIPHLYQLMVRDALLAKARNGSRHLPSRHEGAHMAIPQSGTEPVHTLVAQTDAANLTETTYEPAD